MSLSIKGKIIQVLKAETGVSRAGNEWKKQEFVIETQEQFPKKVCFTLFNDKSSALERFSAGHEVEVFFNLESREYNGKWYSNINAWKIEGAGQAQAPESRPEYRLEDIPPENNDNGDDLLPF